MKLLTLSAFVSCLISFASASPLILQKKNSRWDYENNKLYGVNIGGWLVLEPFINPSLFEAFGGTDDSKPVDEYHFTQAYGKDKALEVLQEHWSTWITADDFQEMASYGLNFVRIPIGYWAFELLDDDPYVQGQVAYLDQAIGWCRDNGLKAWIDLHGVPGSQNGFDNSGLRDQIDWQTGAGNVDLTLKVLTEISEKYSDSAYDDVIIGIELVNEPLGPALDSDALTNYYNQGYEIIRNSGDVPVIIHDAFFQGDGHWDNVLNTEIDPNIWDVYVDHHHYQIFSTGELSRSIDEHVSIACNLGWTETNEYHVSMCGEWTAALTDCAKWLNGMNRGARFDATYDNSEALGTCDGIFIGDYSYFQQSSVRDNYRRYVEAQMDAYLHNKVSGWVFWCWKTESAIEWDFRQLVSLDIIPQPLSGREYYNQCGFDQW